MDINASSSPYITLPHEASHSPIDTVDYFYHSNSKSPVSKIRQDARAFIENQEINNELISKFWESASNNPDALRSLRNYDATLDPSSKFLKVYRDSSIEMQKNYKSEIAYHMISSSEETFIDCISLNADTFSHVFNNLRDTFLTGSSNVRSRRSVVNNEISKIITSIIFYGTKYNSSY